MSMKKRRLAITLPGYVMAFVEETAEEMGCNKSDLIETFIFYVSMPDNFKDYKEQLFFRVEGEDEGEEDKENEEEDEEDEPGFWERLFGSNEEEEEE